MARLARNVAILQLVLASLAAGIWWALGFRTAGSFGSVLFWIGAGALLVASLIEFGSMGISSDLYHQHLRSVGSASGSERLGQDIADRIQAHHHSIILVLAGIISMGIALVIWDILQ